MRKNKNGQNVCTKEEPWAMSKDDGSAATVHPDAYDTGEKGHAWAPVQWTMMHCPNCDLNYKRDAT